MEKNENGYPQGRTAPEGGRNGTNGRTETPTDHINKNGVGDGSGNMNGTNGNGSMNGRDGGNMNGSNNGNGAQNGRMNGGMNDNRKTSPRSGDTMPHSMNNGCGDMSDDCLDGRPLAYVYAPNQRFCMLYSASDALDHGTLFEALYKPMEVYGRE